MEEFLKFISQNINETSPYPYKTHDYVSFEELKEDGGFSQSELIDDIEAAKQKGLLYGPHIYDKKRVALSDKGQYYTENLL